MKRPLARGGHVPSTDPAGLEWRWMLRNELAALTGFNQQVQTLLTAAPAPPVEMATVSSVLLILDELLTNVIKYAHPGEPPGGRLIDVRLGLEADAVRVRIEDDGVPFDPTVDGAQSATGADLSLEERTVGGWGLSLVRKTASSMRYQRAGGRNQLTLHKRLASV